METPSTQVPDEDLAHLLLFSFRYCLGNATYTTYFTGLMAIALVGYTMLLLRMRTLAAEREMKLHFLPSAASGSVEPAPAYAMRRSAN